ncbi:multiheme c-type cytochrome [Serpens gallinarum]|uniref:Tetratricopeptide repeat protein n=1 Tax=Serpens gallinarum TaxID=2763075 RepID=A0ABR8TN53_9PSED|nr:multiheme c-type cytochrome [Serpens gallinarum]MBD7977186.1 tetratricopeptide repeat protein [Serpens gallinarum]
MFNAPLLFVNGRFRVRLVLALLAVAVSCWQPALADPVSGFAGSQACAGCHEQQFAAWQNSQHAHAMQHATSDTVLGDFNDARFSYADVESRFFRRDSRFFVQTDGADGALDEFEIRYTFGVDPLQQYLVEFPDGRLQALSIAWDSRPANEGGQRWFHLYPDDAVSHRDELHWTRPSQNWNHMCADCHSTGLRKGYDPKTDTFATRWAEINVGCEACHGPASNHLAWAKGDGGGARKGLTLILDERRGVSWRRSIEELTAHRDSPAQASKEQQVCAQCHARRSQIAEGYHAGKPLLDHYTPVLLEPGLYHVDGQQREEVFISGSFEQSKMHAAGVTCSNCHDPHSQALRIQGNALCSQCHSPQHFDSPRHHFHPAGSAGAQCVSCHMPQTTYMVIDPRRDHSFRIPRPDLSIAQGTPNACNACHQDKSAEWALKAIGKHYSQPAKGFQQFAKIWADAEASVPGSAAGLIALLNDPAQPALVRASSAARLQRPQAPEQWRALYAALSDPDAQVRRAALGAFAQVPAGQRGKWLAPLLTDPVRSVRSEVARLLIDAPVPEAQQPAFANALAEYEAQLQLNTDRADARSELAQLRRRQSDDAGALEHLQAALRLDPLYQAAYLELAELHRSAGRETHAAQVLREGLALRPQSALLHYSLGLSLVRQQHKTQALEHFRQAQRLAPGDPRFALALALALQAQSPHQALVVVERALVANPNEADLLWLAAAYHLEQGKTEEALTYAERLMRVTPDAPRARQLVWQVRARMAPR